MPDTQPADTFSAIMGALKYGLSIVVGMVVATFTFSWKLSRHIQEMEEMRADLLQVKALLELVLKHSPEINLTEYLAAKKWDKA